MSRRLFRKALNHIESRSCDSNISRLNDELKKTGMLSERMTTSTVLPATETQPFQAPTTSFVPDANGLTDTAPSQSFSAQPTYGGDESDSSTWSTGWNSNAYLLNPNELDGETNRPLTYAPDKTPAGASGLVYGSFYYGTAIGYIDENNVFQSVLPGSLTGGYTGPNQTGLYYPEGSPQRENYERQVSYYNAHLELVNRFGLTNQNFVHRQYTSYVNVWVMHSIHHHGPFENWTSSPKKPGFILRQAEVPTGISARSKYTSDPGQPRTLVLNRLDDPSSPDYHEGDFSRFLANLLNVGKQAFDYLDEKSLEIAGFGPRPDGTTGWSSPGDVNRGHDGTLYKLVPRPGYGYNQWVPIQKASAGEDEIALDTIPYEPPSPGPGGYKRPGSYDPSKFFDIPTNHGPQFPSPNLPDTGPGRSSVPDKDNKKKKQSVVAHHEPQGDVLSEGWQSPDHTNVEKDSKTRWFNPNAGTDSAKWFDPKEVKPAYPAKAPPKMIDGYSADSNLAPKPVEKSPAIKLTKKDLLRNHKLKDSEVAGMMQTIARLNKFIADHPEELIFAKSRYPKHDPRLAELNWNMDQMLKASGDYLDKQFPENERLFARIQNSIVKNIKATDPEEYKEVISTIEAEKKARKIKKSHLSRKVSERERKSAFSRALKHLPTEARVQSDVTKERIEEIAKAELEYLKTIGKPKYYDWKDDGFDFSENFEDRKKSIQHFHSLIDKRIENLENALEEGMTTSEYIKQLYGEIPTITSMMSIDPNLLGSKFAQDVVQDSEKATTHAYGSYFPGSYVNSIGDFNPQSYSKVDVLATASWNSLQSLAPSGWEPDSSYEYVDSVSDVVSFGPETDTFKDTYFGEVTTSGNTISLSTGDDEDSSQENTIDILDLESLFPGVTFPTANPMPGETTREDPIEGSMLLRTFKSIKVGQEISFNYSFTSAETEENPEYVTYRGVSDTGVPGEDAILDDYAFVLIAGRVQKIVSVMAKDGNNIDFNFQGTDADGNPVTTEYKPDILQSRFPLTGKYSYTVRQDDIDDHGNLKLFIGVMDAGDSAYESNLDITNLEIDSSRSAAGQLGKTTDAYNLGTSVASLDPNSKKKKKDEEDDETDSTEQDQEDKDTITKNGITYDKGAYNVLGPYTPSVDKVELYPTYSDIKGQTEPPEPGTEYYLQYYRSYVPKQGSEYEAWLSSIPAEQADKIRDTKQKEDPAANQKYVGKFQMFGKPKLYGKYGDKSYYNPADTGQEVPNQVKITWDPYGAPNRQDRFGQRLANPGEKQDSYGFPLGKDEEESDYTYWKGKRYLKGSYDDTAEIDPKTGKFRGNFSWFAEKDPASAKTGNSDTMSTTTNWKGPRAAWGHREFIGLGPNEEIEQVIQYRKHRDLMRKKYGRLSDIPKQYHKNNNYLESLNRLVVATMPKDWARPFVPVDGEGPEDKLTNNYSDQIARGEEPVPPIPKGNAEADLIAELMLLGPVSVALAKALIAALGLAGASALTKGARVLDQFAKWWNKGKNVRIKDEDSADLFQLFADDIAQRQGIRGPGGQGGWNPFRGMPGYGTAKSKLNPRIRAINKARRAQGKPELSMDKINPGGAQSGPSPSVRQGGRVLTKPLGPTLGARNESYDLIFEQVDPDDKFFQELQKVIVKLKKPEQVEKLSKFLKKVSKAKEESESKTTRPNNSNELYPGQPSPNGFPDTPPSKLAPNGYHPEFGKRANRYRRLDPVSAVMMRKVGTDDPQINKQVSDAARKPK